MGWKNIPVDFVGALSVKIPGRLILRFSEELDLDEVLRLRLINRQENYRKGMVFDWVEADDEVLFKSRAYI